MRQRLSKFLLSVIPFYPPGYWKGRHLDSFRTHIFTSSHIFQLLVTRQCCTQVPGNIQHETYIHITLLAINIEYLIRDTSTSNHILPKFGYNFLYKLFLAPFELWFLFFYFWTKSFLVSFAWFVFYNLSMLYCDILILILIMDKWEETSIILLAVTTAWIEHYDVIWSM